MEEIKVLEFISSGYGSGYGYGYGYGSGDGLKSINGKKVYMVDGIATTISHTHGNTAKGTIVNNDLTETPCYIVKEGRYFAHGETLAEANASLQDKLFEEMPAEERIAEFWKYHKKGVKYPTKDFFGWHHKLTGSCLMGRQQFAKDHLFRWMRDNGYIMRYTNVPTQYSMERGLMEVKERAINNPDGSVRITQTIKVTGKGQAYFVNKFIGG